MDTTSRWSHEYLYQTSIISSKSYTSFSHENLVVCIVQKRYPEQGKEHKSYATHFLCSLKKEKVLIKSDDHICHFRGKGIRKRGHLIIQ